MFVYVLVLCVTIIPLMYVDPNGNMAVKFLNFASWMYSRGYASAKEITTYTLIMNGLNIYNAFHEIAQLNVAKYLYNLGYSPTLEYQVKNLGEIDTDGTGVILPDKKSAKENELPPEDNIPVESESP